MDEIIEINYDTGNPTISARELYGKVGTTERFNFWLDRQLQFGFEEGKDFTSVKSFTVVNNGAKKEIDDYELTIEMAKEVCVIQKSEKARAVRKYLIRINDAWNTPEQVMARALKMADEAISKLTGRNAVLQKEVEAQKQIIGEMKPKADYTDLILNNKGLVTITQIAKDYGMSGQEMNELLHNHKVQYKQSGQWMLYDKYHDKGYTHSVTVNIVRRSGMPDVKMNTKWTQKGRLFIYNTLKDNGYLPLVERDVKQ